LSQYLPGPYATQILADLGAEVVKIEPPGGDPMRQIGPPDGDGVSAFYKLVNAGKTVVRLNLKDPEGRDALIALVARADALIESFRPGTLVRLGLDPDTLRASNPRLIHSALSGFGRDGPYAERAGHDINYMAWGGGLATSGSRQRPEMAHPPTADCASAMQVALVTLAALLRRERSGEGAFLDVSLGETVLAWQAFPMTAALRNDGAARRGEGLLNGGAACYRIYETADGDFVTLGAVEAKFWAAFCRAVGREDWIVRQGEPLPQSALIEDLTALFLSQTLAHWIAVLEPVDCCFQPVLRPAELPSDPQIRARGLVRLDETAEPRVEVSFPAIFDGARPQPRRPLREAGIDEVLGAWTQA
jgi:crotonobetainyl-CoA:carnitine CoA-transferase CaiB-like acyl-CoA transferase